MDEKISFRTHKRKYIGVLFTINGFCYYAPLSSPKRKDFNSNGTIKKNDLLSLKIIKKESDGKQSLLGTIRLLNMIPVPMKYVIGYSVENETDKKYQGIVADELLWIRKNQSFIIKKAKQLYNFKKNEAKLRNEKNAKVYDAILPFIEIEDYLIQIKEI